KEGGAGEAPPGGGGEHRVHPRRGRRASRANPSPARVRANAALRGSKAPPPPPKSTSWLVLRVGRCGAPGAGPAAVLLRRGGATAGFDATGAAAEAGFASTGPNPSTALARSFSRAAATFAWFRRSRSSRAAFLRSICQRWYSPSFSRTRKEVYSLA